MYLNETSVTNKSELDWPLKPCGILIMGKRQGTKKENKQLLGRIAMSAALWYSAPQPKPYLLFVASDTHGPLPAPDAEVVKSQLVNEFGIPADFIILRQKTNCTLIEVRTARVISRAYNLANIFAVTHLYHAPRTQRYINEVLPDAFVIPVHPEILKEVGFPVEADDLFSKIEVIVQDSLPTPLDLTREHIVEWFLDLAHTFDPRGRLERYLARFLRPSRDR
jgi:hypothetical protein